ncbi:diacylglycerol kinase family protein [Yimella sp. cx-51]|uniref:diacylglycerol/lipid kinase family protein n=1 Tax=Yimella sp. cx-51 TaxID=2770551 RepID=UPI00165E127D|nr:diacylglycerol kinase family protein [Yimella sp. cx-51]MBC9957880.1 NAD(+)/NADH kinase [Yimella sp. cx-51]QTH38015.1 NAD(+)/NADH kinase [Yimella sp. cx-51]
MKRAAVIVNPIKIKNLDLLHRQVERVMRAYAWAPPMWLETTIEDPGFGQTQAALDAGVDLVVALGGDGTVRNVSTTLVDTGVPLAILPAGTGNLLARNLGLPTHNRKNALRSALAGRNRTIDTLKVEIDTTGDGEFDDTATSTVMTGCGLDAEIMADTSEKLKARASWLAYPLAGMKYVNAGLTPMRVALDDGPLSEPRGLTTVIVGNCGRLTGGVRLMPDALPDDGLLDVIELSARRLQWARLVSQVLRGSNKPTAQVRHRTGTRVRIECETPTRVEIDGEVHDHALNVVITLQPQSLVVRVP